MEPENWPLEKGKTSTHHQFGPVKTSCDIHLDHHLETPQNPNNPVASKHGTFLCFSGRFIWGVFHHPTQPWPLRCPSSPSYLFGNVSEVIHHPMPVGSIYGMFTHIYHKNQPNVEGKYTRPMDPMGIWGTTKSTSQGDFPQKPLSKDDTFEMCNDFVLIRCL